MTDSLAETFDKDRRLVILRLLAEQDDYSLSAPLITKAAQQLRHRVYPDVVEADLVLLEQHRLLKREELEVGGSKMTIATLTKFGRDVACGRPHPMVARPSPKD
ncbi:Fe2+ or Zn2+ uptake regulation protein [Rhodopseudomonas rhenobacensis]|uniref:Fe2+ or Zn2+ uptake regulation protein n=1 Tax=Rhodopseudomonas rhenobacensis TaxID=87461 RepID=A0A7W7Z2E5_9BRAD|nr:ArsR family transcriptional regulator [Rhodopseudomonas rhenobacensis]MBB5046778.1 Fe2+ or Zn2+ uptake regulation protein [Rhodopseudomonas rhenobacensis]